MLVKETQVSHLAIHNGALELPCCHGMWNSGRRVLLTHSSQGITFSRLKSQELMRSTQLGAVHVHISSLGSVHV